MTCFSVKSLSKTACHILSPVDGHFYTTKSRKSAGLLWIHKLNQLATWRLVPNAIFKLNRHKCTVNRKTWSILRCQTVRVAKLVSCTCRSTHLANHLIIRKATRFHTKGTCNEMPNVVLGLLWLGIIYSTLGKWHSPDSKCHN